MRHITSARNVVTAQSLQRLVTKPSGSSFRLIKLQLKCITVPPELFHYIHRTDNQNSAVILDRRKNMV